MTKETFIKLCAESGYCSRVAAKRYAEKYEKSDYTVEDFEEAYRSANREAVGTGTSFRNMTSPITGNAKTTKHYKTDLY